MQLFPDELALANLKGEIPEGERGYSSKAEAHEMLVELSGQDFGLDIPRWEAWVRVENKKRPSKFRERRADR